ncbi:MAG: hypothetical protein N2688_05190 [Burkholderiaceae bacterium]|nr:hypothetical protein [Burkholderiaceae bacterium]
MRRSRTKTALRAMVAAAACCFPSPASALGLGTPELASHLGQPLALRVPLTGDEGGDFGPQCVRLLPQADGDIPTLGAGRLSLERGPAGSALRISSLQPIQEPALRIVLEVGCQTRLRREFVVLLDPPPVAAGPAPAFEFGAPEVLGAQGQPLLVHVPIVAGPALAPQCVRTARGEAGEMPRVLNEARAALVERDGWRSIRLYTAEAVQDARVRVLVELGCDAPVRHEFAFLLEPPRVAATAAGGVPAAEPRTARTATTAKPRGAGAPARRRSSAPVAPPHVAAPAAAVAHSAPPAAPPPPPPAPADRLVLAAPEESPPQSKPPAEAVPAELLRQVEALTAEVRHLRAELEATQKRSRELEARRSNSGYTWAAALAAVLLFGVGILLGRRAPARREPATDGAGPLTRIMGEPQARRASAAPAAAAAGAAAASTPDPLPHTEQGTAIQVTEIGDTQQAIGELYKTFIASPTQTAPPTKTEIAVDLDVGKERTTLLAPPTKTEIAVDFDLSDRNTEIARQIERAYAAARMPQPEPDPGTPTGATTVPLTRGLDLNLDLPPTVAPPPPKPGERE